MSVSPSASLNGVVPYSSGASASSQVNVTAQEAIDHTNNRVKKLESLPSLSHIQRKTLIRLKLRVAILSQFEAQGNVQITMHKGKRLKGQSQIDSIKIDGKEINLSKINLGKNRESALSQLYKIPPSADDTLKNCNVGLLFYDTNTVASIDTTKKWHKENDYIKDTSNNLIFFIPKKVDSESLVSSGGSKINCIIPKREGNQIYQFAADVGRLVGGLHDSLDLSKDIKDKDKLKVRLNEYNGVNSKEYNLDLIFFVDKDKSTSSSKKIADLNDNEFVFKHYYIGFNNQKYAVVEKKK